MKRLLLTVFVVALGGILPGCTTTVEEDDGPVTTTTTEESTSVRSY